MNYSYMSGGLLLFIFVFLLLKLKKLVNRQLANQLQAISIKLKGIYDDGSFLYGPSCICNYKQHRIKISSFTRGAGGQPVSGSRVLCWYFSNRLMDSILPDFDIRAHEQLYYHKNFPGYGSIYVRTVRQAEINSIFNAKILVDLNKLFLKYPSLHFMATGNVLTISVPVDQSMVDIDDLYLFFTGFIDRVAQNLNSTLPRVIS